MEGGRYHTFVDDILAADAGVISNRLERLPLVSAVPVQ
jgi:hypothetical protein